MPLFGDSRATGDANFDESEETGTVASGNEVDAFADARGESRGCCDVGDGGAAESGIEAASAESATGSSLRVEERAGAGAISEDWAGVVATDNLAFFFFFGGARDWSPAESAFAVFVDLVRFRFFSFVWLLAVAGVEATDASSGNGCDGDKLLGVGTGETVVVMVESSGAATTAVAGGGGEEGFAVVVVVDAGVGDAAVIAGIGIAVAETEPGDLGDLGGDGTDSVALTDCVVVVVGVVSEVRFSSIFFFLRSANMANVFANLRAPGC